MNERLTQMVIAKRKHELGEYRLSIKMDRHHLYIHEMIRGEGDWNICEGLWIYESEYPAFRDASLSLHVQRYGIACVQSDRIETFENLGYSCIFVNRLYIVRQDDTRSLYAVNRISLRSITMTAQDFDTITAVYEQFLSAVPMKTEGDYENGAFHPPL
jgi:hypothetical protein